MENVTFLGTKFKVQGSVCLQRGHWYALMRPILLYDALYVVSTWNLRCLKTNASQHHYLFAVPSVRQLLCLVSLASGFQPRLKKHPSQIDNIFPILEVILQTNAAPNDWLLRNGIRSGVDLQHHHFLMKTKGTTLRDGLCREPDSQRPDRCPRGCGHFLGGSKYKIRRYGARPALIGNVKSFRFSIHELCCHTGQQDCSVAGWFRTGACGLKGAPRSPR